MANQIDYDYDEVIAYIPKAPAGAVEELATNLNTLGNNLTALQEECHSGTNSSSVFTQVYVGFSNIIGDSNKGLGGLTTSAANIMNVSYQEALIDKQIAEGGENVSALYAKRDALTADVTTGSNSPSGSNTAYRFHQPPQSSAKKEKDLTPDADVKYSQVPGKDYERVQGLTKTDDYTIVSSYTKTEPNHEKLYFYDRKTGEYVGEIELDQDGHAGGIAYDEDNGVLYVTGENNKIGVYDYDALVTNMKNNNGGKLSEDNDAYKGYIELPNSTAKPATIYYDNGTLYSSTFVGKGKGVGYNIDVNNLNTDHTSNGKISTGNVDVHSTPRMVQGMVVTEHDGETYEIYSQSYDSGLGSSYCIYKTDDKGNREYVGKVYSDKAGIEGLDINDRGEITACYEFSKETTTVSVDSLINSATKEKNTSLESARNKKGEKYDNDKNPFHYDDYLAIA